MNGSVASNETLVSCEQRVAELQQVLSDTQHREAEANCIVSELHSKVKDLENVSAHVLFSVLSQCLATVGSDVVREIQF